MATEVGSAYVSIIPSAKGFGRNLDNSIGRQVDKSGTTSGKRFGTGFTGGIAGSAAKVGKAVALIAGPLAVLGGVRLLGNFVSDARESARVSALTAQAIKSTGGAAKVSAKDVSRLSTQISNKTGIDDEAIQSGANLLLTFTNIRNEVGKGNKIFDKANVAVTDMSAALGQDTKSSAIQLGKALNDPVKGITALSRVGVAFTQEQKDQIKTLVKSGDTVGAQKIILGELSKEFGGAAAAMATPGEKLKVTLGNLGESIGAQLIPVIDKFATFMVAKGIPALVRFGGFVKSDVLPVLKNIGTFIQTNVLPALVSFGGFIQTKVLPALRTFGTFVATKIVPAFQRFGTFVQTSVLPVLLRLGTFLKVQLGPTFTALSIFITTRVVPAFQGLFARLQAVAPTFLKVARFVGIVVLGLAALAVIVIGKVLPVIFRLAGPVLGLLFGALGRIIGAIAGFVRLVIRIGTVVGKVATTVGTGIVRIVQFFVNLPARVLGAVGSFATTLFQAGRDLITGLVNGIKSLITAPVDAVKGVAGNIKKGFTSVLGIGSPSKVFAGFGLNINQGLVEGLKRSDNLAKRGAAGTASAVTAGFQGKVGVNSRQADVRHTGAAGQAGGDTFIFHNPLPERGSESYQKALQRKKRGQGIPAT